MSIELPPFLNPARNLRIIHRKFICMRPVLKIRQRTYSDEQLPCRHSPFRDTRVSKFQNPRRATSRRNLSDSSNNDEDQKQNFTVRRTTVARGVEAPQPGAWNFNPYSISFEGEPQEKKSTRNESINTRENYDLDDFEMPIDDTQVELEEIHDDDFFQDGNEEHLNLDEERYEQNSTITASEKHAFQKIFKNIFETKQWAEKSAIFGESIDSDNDTDAERRKNRRREADNQLTQIISESYFQTPKTKEEIENVVKQYPPALQASAAQAMGLDDLIEGENTINSNRKSDQYYSSIDFKTDLSDKAKILSEQKRIKDLEDKIEAVRESEQTRVEALMRAAQTDFELWKVLEDEVFILVKKMGLEEIPKPVIELSPVRLKKTKSKKLSSSKSTGLISVNVPLVEKNTRLDQKEIPTDELASQHNIPPLQLYGPLYPSYLLLGLRLLDRSFSRPSPLALAILPKIKSLGYISRVLGASTQLYNELLLIYRYRQNDFQGMLRLLEEMEFSSLVMNQETLNIVVQLSRTQDRIRQGTQGVGMSHLWALPNFARGRFGPWRDHLREKIESELQLQQKDSPWMRSGLLPRSKQVG
ncbi:hypothetical protein BGHDH14_bgh01351 [Blumeria hordei DH14]|uniref:Mtf2-like C-terminal domain-containing protein n=1 Tax=Blumeria graminis f. sp. hordei (strain DH14) TaxID=546991 RepID=N1JD05_BLUG1|nr:hypothetical protein BGHDH14_bgh01351 [Blumeria hordei DH14]